MVVRGFNESVFLKRATGITPKNSLLLMAQ